MADRRRPVPARESECESEGNPNEDLSEYESANEESKDGELGEGEEEEDDDSEETDSEEGETSDDDDDEDGEYSEDVVVEGEYEDGWVEEERQSGDGQEQPEASTDDLDDDEDKKNPAYVPRKGAFYEHDLRIDESGELKEERPKKKLWKDDGKWLHDRYSETQQAPKSREELIALYGYDIRAHDKPPDRAPRMNRRREGNPRDRKRLGDFISDRPRQKTDTPPRYSNNRNRESHDNEDDRSQYDNNRSQYDNNSQRNSSYQNRKNSYNEERRGQSYQNLKDKGPRDYHAERYDQQKSYDYREGRQDNRARQEQHGQQDVRYQNRSELRQYEDSNRRSHDNDYREPKGRSDRDHKGPPDHDHRGPGERDHRGPGERDHRGPSERDHRGPSDRDYRGPARNQGGKGPRLQRGGHNNSAEMRNSNRGNNGDVRNSRPNFSERGSDSQGRQYTNSGYQGSRGADNSAEVKTDEPDTTETIQINVVNKNALIDKKSYSRERRGKFVGRTRLQENTGFSMDQSLAKDDRGLPPRQAPPSQVNPRDQKSAHSPNLPTSPTAASPHQEQKPFPPQPIIKQEAGQNRPKRYSSQRQRSLPEPQYPEQAASPVENQGYFNQGFRPQAPIFRPEQPGPAAPRPRQEAPFPPTAMLPPQLHYPVPVSSAGLSSPPRLFAGGPPVSLAAGQQLIASPYMPTGMMYGAPPPYRMPAPVPVQNFPTPPPVTVQVPQPVQLQPTQPSPAEVYRGGTTYYAPQLQQSNPNRSPVRRPKLAIPIVRPEETQGDNLSPSYYQGEQDSGEYLIMDDDPAYPTMHQEHHYEDTDMVPYPVKSDGHDAKPSPHGNSRIVDNSSYPSMPEEPPPESKSRPMHPTVPLESIQQTGASAGDTQSNVKLEPVTKEESAPVESSYPDIAAGGDNQRSGQKVSGGESDTREVSLDSMSAAVKEIEHETEKGLDIESSVNVENVSSDSAEPEGKLVVKSETT
ncbi:protein CASC3-like [Liolophura sinensis]|uniref:protein CASC3-like n=1 Tax=Liolophura sinensis TaxID=3198878 RepID=UPI0031589CE1